MIDNPVVLVTGAARRVGAEIARALHAAGARVVLHYRSHSAEEVARSLNEARPDSAFCIQGDLRDCDRLPALVETAVGRWGRLDALVNNASSFFATPVGSIDELAWDDLIGSNLKGPLFLSQAVAPRLKATQGVIVNITDIHAEHPLKNYPLYSITKAGLLGLTRALALELAPEVRVNAVAPGPIEWPEGNDFNASARAEIISHTLLKRKGQPSDVACAVRFLLFDAPFVTGQVINVDGGRSAHL